jgi:hypothetical protein
LSTVKAFASPPDVHQCITSTVLLSAADTVMLLALKAMAATRPTRPGRVFLNMSHSTRLFSLLPERM